MDFRQLRLVPGFGLGIKGVSLDVIASRRHLCDVAAVFVDLKIEEDVTPGVYVGRTCRAIAFGSFAYPDAEFLEGFSTVVGNRSGDASEITRIQIGQGIEPRIADLHLSGPRAVFEGYLQHGVDVAVAVEVNEGSGYVAVFLFARSRFAARIMWIESLEWRSREFASYVALVPFVTASRNVGEREVAIGITSDCRRNVRRIP